MNIPAKLCAAGVALLFASGAQAALITYRFTATVDDITTYIPNCGACGGGGSASGDEIWIDGAPVRLGATVAGTIAYDNATAVLSETVNPDMPYTRRYYEQSPAENLSFSYVGNPYIFTSLQNFVKQVTDARDGYKFDMPFQGARDPNGPLDSGRGAALSIEDPQPSESGDAPLPAALDLARFPNMFLMSYFNLYESTTIIRSHVTSIQEVPEPGALALIAAGAVGMGAVRRRRRRGALN